MKFEAAKNGLTYADVKERDIVLRGMFSAMETCRSGHS